MIEIGIKFRILYIQTLCYSNIADLFFFKNFKKKLPVLEGIGHKSKAYGHKAFFLHSFRIHHSFASFLFTLGCLNHQHKLLSKKKEKFAVFCRHAVLFFSLEQRKYASKKRKSTQLNIFFERERDDLYERLRQPTVNKQSLLMHSSNILENAVFKRHSPHRSSSLLKSFS